MTTSPMSYKDKIYDTAVEIFEDSCFIFPLAEDEVEEENSNRIVTAAIKGAVQFDGATKGVIVITPSSGLLSAMASNMLGIDHPNENEKKEGLCEVANIISGNIAPLFSWEDGICYTEPPKLVEDDFDPAKSISGTTKESVRVYLGEGVVDIEVYYQIKEIR